MSCLHTHTYPVQVTSHYHAAEVSSPPVDGVYVCGLWLDGGRWDADARCLQQPAPGVLYSPLPVVHFRPEVMGGGSGEGSAAHDQQGSEAQSEQQQQPSAGQQEQYQCPLYKTSVRAGVLSTTGQSTTFVTCVGLPTAPGSSSDAWVLQGVALLCMLND